MADNRKILNKVDGMYIHDASAIHMITPDVSTYTVTLGDPGSAFCSTLTVTLPTDVMLKTGSRTLTFKGIMNAGTEKNPALTPDAVTGDIYEVGSDGYINTTKVDQGDMLFCIADSSAATASSASTVDANWNYIQGNVDEDSIPKSGHVHDLDVSISTEYEETDISVYGTISKPNITPNYSTKTITYVDGGSCSFTTVSSSIGMVITDFEIDANDSENIKIVKKVISYDETTGASFTPSSSTFTALTDMKPVFDSNFVFTGDPLEAHRHAYTVDVSTDGNYSKQPLNVMYYTTTDGKALTLSSSAFNANIITNTYEDGKGKVEFDDTLTTLTDYAFQSQSTLATITFPDSMMSLGEATFYKCSSLTTFKMPPLIINVSQRMFYNCSSLVSIDFQNATAIANYAFYGCSSLTSLTLTDKIISLGEFTLPGNLTTLRIGSGLSSISSNCVQSTNNMTSIIVSPGNMKYNGGNNSNCIIETSSNTLILGCMNTLIPSTVTKISFSAFSGCTGMAAVDIPAAVSTIEGHAFENCVNLMRMTVRNQTPPSLGYNALNNVPVECDIFVPSASVLVYKNANRWSERANKIQAIS